jgi:hypothetical protein
MSPAHISDYSLQAFDELWCKGNEKLLFEHQRIKLGLVSIKNQTWGLGGFQFQFSPSLF